MNMNLTINDLDSKTEDDYSNLRNSNKSKYFQYCKAFLQYHEQAYEIKLDKISLAILKVPSEERYDDELQILQKWTKEFDFFKTLNNKASQVQNKLHEKCCAKMQFYEVKAGTTIFKQGDLEPEGKFYIVLSGECTILVLKSQHDLQQQIQEDHHNKEKLTAKQLEYEAESRIKKILEKRKKEKLLEEKKNKMAQSNQINIHNDDIDSSSLNNQQNNNFSPAHSAIPADKEKKFSPLNLNKGFFNTMGINIFNKNNSDQNQNNQQQQQNTFSTKSLFGKSSQPKFLQLNADSPNQQSLNNSFQNQNKQMEESKQSNFSSKKQETENNLSVQTTSKFLTKSPKNNNQNNLFSTPQNLPASNSLFGQLKKNNLYNTNQQQESNNNKSNNLSFNNNNTNMNNSNSKIEKSPQNKEQKPPEKKKSAFTNFIKSNLQKKELDVEDYMKLNRKKDKPFKQLGGIDITVLDQPEDYFIGNVCKYFPVITKTQGQMFGELALINSQPRNATVTAKTDVQFAILSARDYKKILKGHHEKKLNQKLDFFQKNMFQELGRIIYKEKDKCNYVYLIKKGTVEIVKNVKIQEQELDKQDLTKNTLLQKYKDIETSHQKIQIHKLTKVHISTLTVGQCFGEAEVIKGIDRQFLAQVSSNQAVIYQIGYEKFMNAILSNPILEEKYLQQIELKEQWIQQQLKNHSEGRYINHSSIMEEAQRAQYSKKLPFTVTKNDIEVRPLFNPQNNQKNDQQQQQSQFQSDKKANLNDSTLNFKNNYQIKSSNNLDDNNSSSNLKKNQNIQAFQNVQKQINVLNNFKNIKNTENNSNTQIDFQNNTNMDNQNNNIVGINSNNTLESKKIVQFLSNNNLQISQDFQQDQMDQSQLQKKIQLQKKQSPYKNYDPSRKIKEKPLPENIENYIRKKQYFKEILNTVVKERQKALEILQGNESQTYQNDEFFKVMLQIEEDKKEVHDHYKKSQTATLLNKQLLNQQREKIKTQQTNRKNQQSQKSERNHQFNNKNDEYTNLFENCNINNYEQPDLKEQLIDKIEKELNTTKKNKFNTVNSQKKNNMSPSPIRNQRNYTNSKQFSTKKTRNSIDYSQIQNSNLTNYFENINNNNNNSQKNNNNINNLRTQSQNINSNSTKSQMFLSPKNQEQIEQQLPHVYKGFRSQANSQYGKRLLLSRQQQIQQQQLKNNSKKQEQENQKQQKQFSQTARNYYSQSKIQNNSQQLYQQQQSELQQNLNLNKSQSISFQNQSISQQFVFQSQKINFNKLTSFDNSKPGTSQSQRQKIKEYNIKVKNQNKIMKQSQQSQQNNNNDNDNNINSKSNQIQNNNNIKTLNENDTSNNTYNQSITPNLQSQYNNSLKQQYNQKLQKQTTVIPLYKRKQMQQDQELDQLVEKIIKQSDSQLVKKQLSQSSLQNSQNFENNKNQKQSAQKNTEQETQQITKFFKSQQKLQNKRQSLQYTNKLDDNSQNSQLNLESNKYQSQRLITEDDNNNNFNNSQKSINFDNNSQNDINYNNLEDRILTQQSDQYLDLKQQNNQEFNKRISMHSQQIQRKNINKYQNKSKKVDQEQQTSQQQQISTQINNKNKKTFISAINLGFLNDNQNNNGNSNMSPREYQQQYIQQQINSDTQRLVRIQPGEGKEMFVRQMIRSVQGPKPKSMTNQQLEIQPNTTNSVNNQMNINTIQSSNMQIISPLSQIKDQSENLGFSKIQNDNNNNFQINSFNNLDTVKNFNTSRQQNLEKSIQQMQIKPFTERSQYEDIQKSQLKNFQQSQTQQLNINNVQINPLHQNQSQQANLQQLGMKSAIHKQKTAYKTKHNLFRSKPKKLFILKNQKLYE